MAQKDYRQTLLLPQTDFPMKGKLSETEPKRVRFWEEKNIHKKIQDKNKKGQAFFLPDGPPYANGKIHIGTALNKILKDILVKYKSLRGFKAPFLPSFDCHGLPIELQALAKTDKKEPSLVRKACRKEASFWMNEQRESFKRLGVLGDWANPLLTMDSFYEAEEVRVFSHLIDKDLLYRGLKPIHWCFKLQTALSFSEAEYKEHKSPSIYVRFYLDEASLKKLGLPEKTALVIWTTTPWTLPANTGIALGADFDYEVYSKEGESLVLAKELASTFFEEAGESGWKKTKELKGKDFENLKAHHPFLDRLSHLVLGDHVSLEAGTGLVHTAPGHGLDDYFVGKKYKLEVLCPVDEKGHFTQDVPDFLKGVFIFKGNKLIMESLKKSGHLIFHKDITHSYPYSSRSNSPLIFRLAAQWFLDLDKKTGGSSIRQKALKACESEIEFLPEFGRQRLEAMLKTSPDWCLSRQRSWGVPIVVFYCKNCKEALLDGKLVRDIADKMEKSGEGIEYYFQKEVSELVGKRSCKSCGSKEFEKGQDILDVWFDSGIQHFVYEKARGKEVLFPASVYLEGSDQHRGWFQTSLITSLALKGKPPFQTLLTHGFVNDSKGHKMSKSKGNVLNTTDFIEKKGAEILRLWVSSCDFSFDLSASEESFKRMMESYRRFRNTFRFLLGNLQDFKTSDRLKFKDLSLVDQWMMGELETLLENLETYYDEYAFHKVYKELSHFFTVKLSSFYLDIIKDRLYTLSKEGKERRAAQTVLSHILEKLTLLMAPVSSFLSEEVYSYMGKKEESVFLETWPEKNKNHKSEKVQSLFSKLFPLREELNKKLEDLRNKGEIRSNLEAQAHISLKEDLLSQMSSYELTEFFGVSSLTSEKGELEIKVSKASGDKCVRCWMISSLNPDKICEKCVRSLS